MRDSLLKGLNEEQIEKARSCKSSSELLKLAKREGVVLTDEQLAAVNGGCLAPVAPQAKDCPRCESSNTVVTDWDVSDRRVSYHCNACGFDWEGKR